jgi:hypothetical protein
VVTGVVVVTGCVVVVIVLGDEGAVHGKPRW